MTPSHEGAQSCRIDLWLWRARFARTRSAAAEWARFNVLVNAIAPAAAGTVFEKLCQEHPGFREAAARRKPSISSAGAPSP